MLKPLWRYALKKLLVILPIIMALILIGLYILGGRIMNKPLISEEEIILEYNVKTIWDIVVNNSDYGWRSAIKKIELLDNESWIEYYDADEIL
jgi:uncharacterized SAM-binding protein YcdF (DUF218 family)